MKKALGAAALAVALLAAGLASGCGAAHRTPAARAPASTAPASTAPASVADPSGQSCAALDSAGYCPGDDPTAAPAPTQQSAMQQWCSGPGFTDFGQVSQDLTQLQTDSGNDDLLAVEQDGTSLFQDAHAAAQAGLPPLSNTHKVDYGVWMGYVMVAGYKASTGDISGAASALQAATTYNSTVSYVSGQCGGG